MNGYRLWATVSCFLVGLSPGCLYDDVCGNEYFHLKEWVQPGLYAEMPANGTYDDFKVVHVDESLQPGLVHEYVHAQKWSDDLIISFKVDEKNQTFFSASSKFRTTGPLLLNETFEALGLNPPRPPDWAFDSSYGNSGC